MVCLGCSLLCVFVREQRSLDQELRRQQDEEYRRSLEADREKVRIIHTSHVTINSSSLVIP